MSKRGRPPTGCPEWNAEKQVWEALLGIPFGETRTYGQLAKQLGNPNATRAVGAAAEAPSPQPVQAGRHVFPFRPAARSDVRDLAS